MVARAWGQVRGDAKKLGKGAEALLPQVAVEELFLQNDAVSLCLLVNRRAKAMRVVDFRAGPSNAKRVNVLKFAAREDVEKVFTLVERDEVSTWMKMGFTREANIPGFYKRSDAFILGCSVATSPIEGDLRVALPGSDDELEDDEDEVRAAAIDAAERTLAKAKKATKELLDRPLPLPKIAPTRDAEDRKLVDRALRNGRALTAFEHFGRDATRRAFTLTSRGGFELLASIETQSCFGNAFLELLTAPTTEAERLGTVAALRTMCDTLSAEGIGSCFALTPSDDVMLATAFVYNGFRRTGLLQNHLTVGKDRKDAIVWARKLATPGDD